MKGMHTATCISKIILLTAPSCLAGLFHRIKENKTGFLVLKATVPKCLHLAWSESLIQYLIWYHTLSCTQTGWAAEKAGCAEEHDSFKNLWLRPGSWKRIGERGAGLWEGKAMCCRSCKTGCDPFLSLIASPHSVLRHFLSRTSLLDLECLQKTLPYSTPSTQI